MKKEQCSELFFDVFDSRCGGCLRTCECGITHFDAYNIWDCWEDGQLEDLQQKAKDDPEHYVEHDCAVGTMEIDGIEIVYNCTCDLARKYENFVLNHARQLAEYLNKRAAALREQSLAIEVKTKNGVDENV